MREGKSPWCLYVYTRSIHSRGPVISKFKIKKELESELEHILSITSKLLNHNASTHYPLVTYASY